VLRALVATILFALGTLAAYAADGYQVVHTYPHDAQAFTQGLVFVDGRLYESTGRNGQSSLRMDELASGKVLQRSSSCLISRLSMAIPTAGAATQSPLRTWARTPVCSPPLP